MHPLWTVFWFSMLVGFLEGLHSGLEFEAYRAERDDVLYKLQRPPRSGESTHDSL